MRNTIQHLIAAGVRLGYCKGCVMPQTPYVIDVLHVLKLTREQHAYDMCLSNHEPYVANVLLVASIAINDLRDDKGNCKSNEEIKKTIAKIIVALTDEEGACLFNSTYRDAKCLAGLGETPTGQSADQLRALCGCKDCRNWGHEEFIEQHDELELEDLENC